MRLFTAVLLLAALWAAHSAHALPSESTAALEQHPPVAVDSAQVCSTVTLNDATHNVLLNFAITNPLLTYNGFPVYVAPNPFSTNTQFPVLYMYYNKNLGNNAVGWCVAAVTAPVDGPFVYYLVYGALPTPFSAPYAWITGVLYTPGGAMQAVTAVACSAWFPFSEAQRPARHEAPAHPEAQPALGVTATGACCNTVVLNDSTHNVTLNFALTSPLKVFNGLPVYVAPNPFPATNAQYPVLFMYFNRNLGGGAVGWCVAPVATPVDGPFVYYLVYGNLPTPYASPSAWITGVLYTPGGAMQPVTPGVFCRVCSAVTVDDSTHNITLDFAITSPLMTFNGLPVYAAVNPFPATNAQYPVLYMYFNRNLGGGAVGWCVAPIATPADGPFVYYLVYGNLATPYASPFAWVTGVLYTPGGAGQAVTAVGCTGFSPSAMPIHPMREVQGPQAAAAAEIPESWAMPPVEARPQPTPVARATVELPEKACLALTEEKVRSIVGAIPDVTITLSCPKLVLSCAGSAARAERMCGGLREEILHSDSAVRHALLSAAELSTTP